MNFVRYAALLAVFAVMHLCASGQQAKPQLSASAIKGQIVIDGKFNEPEWQHADKTARFIQNSPLPGAASTQRTEVSILYDNNAVYIGAMLYDDHPDSILTQLSSRDDYANNNDAFGVFFDTYFDQQNAAQFIVTAAGVQADGIVKFDGTDFSWNAAWYSKAVITDKGWCVEMKIPYSALRFPLKKEQLWGLNFFRIIRRNREKSFWSNVAPNVPNVLSQSGVLTGIHDIKAPVRLFFLPYISGYAENYAGANAHTFNGGLDIKYGINESFTLDMTLVPDFGQTLFDNRVLNLSPVEVRYDERRYFFTEGVDLFNKNDLFYSRRVGGVPVNAGKVFGYLNSNEIIDESPASTKLYNAVKISGRTKNKLGVGFFNAVSAPAYATLRDTITGKKREVLTSPLTNYNVVVLDQALKNNSYISFINTNVSRKDSSYNADVSALLFKFANKKNTYGINGSADVSQLFKPDKTDVGYRYYLQAGKISGNYTVYLTTRSISDRFNPNDLGYLDRNNITYYSMDHYYNTYKPFGIVNTTYNHVGISYNRIFNPDVYSVCDIFGSHNLVTKDFFAAGAYWDLFPFDNRDYNEPRTFGRYYNIAVNNMAGGFISSDYRKKFALDLESSNRWYAAGRRNNFYWSVSPRYRFTDKFSMIYSLEGLNQINDVGFVSKTTDSIYFGVRDVNTITNTLTAAYIFTNKMSLKLNARHYWAQADYSKYGTLNAQGGLDTTSYSNNHNINFNSFNVFMSFVWQFKPGSEMSVVYQNSIYASGKDIEHNYFNDLNATIQAPQSNSLSVKIIYYLDYLTLRSALRKSSQNG